MITDQQEKGPAVQIARRVSEAPGPAILLERASRWYGQVIGINDVTCALGPGLTALLGPNGAGKSTLIKLVTGQLKPTRGRVTVLGRQPFANVAVFRQLGYCPEIDSFWEEMSGREFVTLLGAMGGVPPAKLRARVAEVIERVGMTPHCDRKIGGYSKGMRQRIKIAQGIVHDPHVFILDEPLNGLDPPGRRDVSQLLRQLGAEGRCILVSSHILYEVEQLTHRILLMNRGRLLAQGDIYQIRGLIDKHPHRIALRAPRARALGRRLLEFPGVVTVHFDDRDEERVEVETRAPDQFYAQFPNLVLLDGYEVLSIESPDNNLEAVFRYLVNE
jgi:ABC-2 type transport system ATP-binding protein